MFQSAYLKLTVFYVATIMLISLIFSVWVYTEATRELETGLTARDRFTLRQIRSDASQSATTDFLHDRLEEGRVRVIINLLYFNLVLLGVGSALSYWLARRTMQPIEEAMLQQNQFTADASHELRTPLASIKMEIEVALRDHNRSKEDTEQLLQSNLEEVNRLITLSEGLLSLARGDEKELVKGRVNVAELMKELKQQFRLAAKSQKITIKNNVNEDLFVQVNRSGLERILAVLIDNALKYSAEKTTVTFSSQRRKNKLLLHIADQGKGIALKDRVNIFKRFYRIDDSRSEQYTPGNGLGLAIAKRLADEMGVQLSVKSNKKNGSVFTVTIPD